MAKAKITKIESFKVEKLLIGMTILLFIVSISKFCFDKDIFQLKTFLRVLSLQSQNKDININNLNVDGKVYSVKEGKVIGKVDLITRLKILDLAAFYQWNKEDPLFYSPDMDLENIKKAILNINADQNKLLAIIKQNQHIHPTDFLNSFVDSSNSMAKFLQNPTLDNSKLLINQQKKTAQIYGQESSNLSSFVLKFNTNHNLPVISFNISKSINSFTSDLSKIASNSDVLLSEIIRREKCLDGTGECHRPGLNFEKPKGEVLIENKPEKKLLDPKIIFEPMAKTLDDSKVKGPYIARTPCFGWGDNFSYPQRYFYLQEGPMTNIQLATDIYIRKLNPQEPSEKLPISMGLTYYMVSSSKLYECPYSENLAEISEMHVFFSNNKALLSSIRIANNNDFDTAKRVEEEFFKSQYPSYDNAQILAEYYGYLYRLIIQDKTISEKYPALKDELLRRKLVLTLKLGDFDKLLAYADNSLKTSIKIEQAFTSSQTANFTKSLLYPFRNFYSVLYIPFSTAVYRNKTKLDYVDRVIVEGAVGPNSPQMLYDKSLKGYQISSFFKFVFFKEDEIQSLTHKK